MAPGAAPWRLEEVQSALVELYESLWVCKQRLWGSRCSSAHVPSEDRGTRAGGNYTFRTASLLDLLAIDILLDIILESYT